jgi:hypothetical protein
MTRRSLIQRAFLVLGVDLLALIGCVSRRAADRPSARRESSLGRTLQTGPLSPLEMEDLIAFGEVLVAGGVLPPDERQVLSEYIEERAKSSPEQLTLYRTVASTLERLAARRFASLEVRERLEIIAHHGLAGRRVQAGDDSHPLAADIRALRTRAVPDLIRGYYSSSAGWAVVGYHTFPGRCGDLMRYTRPES